MFRGKKGAGTADEDVMGSQGRAPDMAIYGGNAFGHSVSPTAHLFGECDLWLSSAKVGVDSDPRVRSRSSFFLRLVCVDFV